MVGKKGKRRRKKGLKCVPCSFLLDVLCPYRNVDRLVDLATVRPCLMGICWSCRYFKRFNREMLREDEEFWEWEERVRANPEAYLRGEL